MEVPDEVMVVRRSSCWNIYVPLPKLWSPQKVHRGKAVPTMILPKRVPASTCFRLKMTNWSISYPSPASDDTLFYVALRNSTLDFCWQAFIRRRWRDPIIWIRYDRAQHRGWLIHRRSIARIRGTPLRFARGKMASSAARACSRSGRRCVQRLGLFLRQLRSSGIVGR